MFSAFLLLIVEAMSFGSSFEPESLMCTVAPAESPGAEADNQRYLCVESDDLGVPICRSVPTRPDRPSSSLAGFERISIDTPAVDILIRSPRVSPALTVLRLGESNGFIRRIDRPPAHA